MLHNFRTVHSSSETKRTSLEEKACGNLRKGVTRNEDRSWPMV
jgi:hypothetical protein